LKQSGQALALLKDALRADSANVAIQTREYPRDGLTLGGERGALADVLAEWILVAGD
jgi:hypothetical protein